MKSVKILLSMAESVKKFVAIVSKYPYVIDAKSIMGIFSLDLSKPVVLEVHSDKCDDLLGELKDYIVD